MPKPQKNKSPTPRKSLTPSRYLKQSLSSNLKNTQSPHKQPPLSFNSRISSNLLLNSHSIISSNLYFCHFKNCIYMGGVKAFQKNGQGILLHDNGTNVISSYYNDLLHGHNVFFTDHRLLSAEYNKNKLVQAVYRTQGFLMYLKYGQDGLLDGKCVLINYLLKSILYCVFRKANVTEKYEQTDFLILNKVFELSEIDFLIGKRHQKALKYHFDRQNNLVCQRIGNKLVVGYEKNSLMNGLGFSYSIRSGYGNTSKSDGNIETSHKYQDNFQMILLQRGYYISGQLNGFGQKIFKNGNSYIGELKNDIFQGNGILKNILKKNWVNGIFEKGNLIDLIEYNHEGGDKKYDRIVQSYHEKRSNWINNEVSLINWGYFDQQVQRMINIVPNTQVKTLEQRKQEVLKKIQQNFICEGDISSSSVLMNTANLKQYTGSKQNGGKGGQKQSVRKFVRNFILQTENITPSKYQPKTQFGSTSHQPNRTTQKSNSSNIQLSSSRKKQNTYFFDEIRRTNNSSIRKSRIFQNDSRGNNNNNKSSDSLLRLNRVEDSEAQGNINNKSPFNKSRSMLRSSNKKSDSPNRQIFTNGSTLNKNFNNTLGFTQQTNKNSPSNNLDTKRSQLDSRNSNKSKKYINYGNRSRIFNNQEYDDDITPKFSYNQKEIFRQSNSKSGLRVEIEENEE